MFAKCIAFFNALQKGVEWVSEQLGWITGALSVLMTLAILREVIGRYFFHSPTEWVMEFSSYLLVAMAYLASASTELKGGHIRIDFIYMHFKGRFKSAVNVFIYLIAFCWCSIIMYVGGEIAWESLVKNVKSSSPIMWPLFPSQVTIPIGAFLLCLILIIRFIQNIKALFKKKE